MSSVTIAGEFLQPFRIVVEGDCYTVYEDKVSSTGKEYAVPLGHFSDFGNAMFEAAKAKAHKNLDDQTVSIKEYVSEFKKAQDGIRKLLR